MTIYKLSCRRVMRPFYVSLIPDHATLNDNQHVVKALRTYDEMSVDEGNAGDFVRHFNKTNSLYRMTRHNLQTITNRE